VLPTSLGAKWTLSQICAVFDRLPPRELRRINKDGEDTTVEPNGDEQQEREVTSLREDRDGATRSEESNKSGRRSKGGEKRPVVTHQDAKRVLLAMKAHEGMGGDGTVVYYIVQEGEVKPRQN
jgi:tRNA-splicing endonuclease subunit Sen15, fungi type